MNLAQSLMYIDRLAEAQAELEQWPDAKLNNLVMAAKYGFSSASTDSGTENMTLCSHS
jgi:hypothetical protein